MTGDFGQLLTPNSTASVSWQDFIAYSFGGFLLSLPFLPIPEVRFYFAVFTFFVYVAVFLTLTMVDLIKILRMSWSKIWQIEFLRIRIFLSGEKESMVL